MNKNLTLEDRINQTALKMFSENGFDAVTVNEICKEVGITKPTFYRYVSSKEEILENYYHFQPSAEFPKWDEVVDENYWKPIEKGFSMCYEHYLSLGSEMLSRLLISQISKSSFTLQDSPEWNERILELIDDAQKHHQIQNEMDPEELKELMVSVSMGYCFYSCTEEDDSIGIDEYKQILRTVGRVSPCLI